MALSRALRLGEGRAGKTPRCGLRASAIGHLPGQLEKACGLQPGLDLSCKAFVPPDDLCSFYLEEGAFRARGVDGVISGGPE